jgi:general L-amino acid transport system permease protein
MAGGARDYLARSPGGQATSGLADEARPPRRRISARRALTTLAFTAVLILVAGLLVYNINQNLAGRGLSLTFDFLRRPAGFDIAIKAIEFSPRDTYADAALVGIANTLVVSAMAVATATLLGFLGGAALLSTNPLLARITLGIVELIRNTPQLLQILFVYTVILRTLPAARDSLSVGGLAFLNVRGLFLPAVVDGPAPMPGLLVSAGRWVLILALAGVSSFLLPLRGRRRWALAALALAAAVALAAFLFASGAWRLDPPVLRGFNFRGGIQIVPEFVALWIGLAVYASAFIADLVRGAVLSVPRGQEEAAASLGLRPAQVLWLVRIPQALRILVPPLVSQYLNIVKSSTLGLAIAYPEIMAVVAGTTLNQTGHAIETMLIVMVFFLALNLLISLVINLYNRRLLRRGLS